MKPETVEDYIQQAPAASRPLAEEVRQIIQQAAPEAVEKLSYGMPYYSDHGRLVYFAAHKDYLGLYVMSASREALQAEIEPYRTAKATLHFPVGKPLPKGLIKKIIRIQAAANRAK